MKTFATCLVLFLVLFSTLQADEISKGKIYQMKGEQYSYTYPSTFQFATTLPSNYWSFLKNSFSFSDDNLIGWAAIIGSSAILIHYDQKITNNVQKFGRKVGIGNQENTVGTLRIGGSALLRRPSDLGSALYFTGDGWITLGLAGGFLTNGLITKDERTMTVTHELIQGLLLAGLTTQIIKRTTGRESPIKSSAPGGVWKFFRSTSTFQGNISKYDAFPSGHLATTMTTFMIISENYPEYTWIKPVGYTVMSLLSFQMINNSVHWAGDYPLALGIGYVLGKTIVSNGRKKVDGKKDDTEVTIYPSIAPNGGICLNTDINF
jgi:membrane-associated PAP2 superfamily phosphatase